jgi:rhodanese-related sulfurtransferase
MKTKSIFWYFLFFFLLILGIIIYLYHYAISSPYLISSDVAKILVKNNKLDVILDVRTPLERQTLGFYPGSVNIQTSDLEEKMPKMYPNKNNLILLYCNTGQRARNATEKLHKMGYSNAIYIASGYKSLIE